VEEFVFSSVSDLYRDNTTTDDLEVIGTHEKTYTFNQDGLFLNQKVVFDESIHLERSYLTMLLPILRENEDMQITELVTSDNFEETIDVSNEDEFEINLKEASHASIGEKESGVVANVNILSKESDTPTQLFISNAPKYNKLYFSYIDDGYVVEAGEEWSQGTHYQIYIEDSE